MVNVNAPNGNLFSKSLLCNVLFECACVVLCCYIFLANKIVLSNSGQYFSLCRNKKPLKLKVSKSSTVLFYLTTQCQTSQKGVNGRELLGFFIADL